MTTTTAKTAGIKAGLIGAGATLLVALICVLMTFSALRQDVANLCEGIKDQTVLIRALQQDSGELAERVASLEAKVSVILPRAAYQGGEQ